MAVGVAVSATFVLLIVGLIILVCVLANRSPRKRQGMANTVKKGTQNISKKLVNYKTTNCDFFYENTSENAKARNLIGRKLRTRYELQLFAPFHGNTIGTNL
jgi:hypothetical protein